MQTIISYSQLNYSAALSQNTTSVYTDLDTSGTAITNNFNGSAMTFDDDNSSIQNIGFNFIYNGQIFTQFVLNSNGFIRLGNTAPLAYTPDVLASGETNTIAAFNIDLDGGTSPQYKVLTTGVAGSRICTIQFKNLREYDNTPPTQYAQINFQIKLYESSNIIEFIYGGFTAGAASPLAMNATVGLKGSNAASSVNATKGAGTSWASATFINGNYTGNKFDNRNDVLPTIGRKLKFTALIINDASVDEVYSLFESPIPSGNYQKISTRIRNTGTTRIDNLPVTLSVNGATSYSHIFYVDLEPLTGTLVTFNFSAVNPGLNKINVTIPADDTTTNNSDSSVLNTNLNTYSYADNSPVSANLGWGTGAGFFLTKYSISTLDTVALVKVKLGIVGNGNTIYAVLLNSAGTIIAQSNAYVTQSSDDGTIKEFVLNNPPPLANTDFYVGLAQTANPSTPYYPISIQAEEFPARPAAYYYSVGLGGGLPTETNADGRFMISAVLKSRNQFDYRAADAQNVAGVYTDLGTSGTAVTTNFDGNPMTFDDDNSSVQNIGFNFQYNGTVYTQFILNSNGFIKLGNTPGIPNNYDILATSENDIIAPFSYDLDAGTGTPEYRVFTSGAPGSRVCTIQFENLREWASPRQYNNINFQVKLYETSTNIEFVYGSFTTSGNSAGNIPAIVGIKGSALLSPLKAVNATKAVASTWASATFINGNYTGNKFNNRNTVLPPSGRTLRFRAIKDAKVDAVYTFSKVQKPLGTYHNKVSAKIRNTGSVYLIDHPVTLNITGANTYTNVKQVSLAPTDSAVITFDHASFWTAGTNTVTVSVASDDVNTNNSATYSQVVNDTLFSYADASSPVDKTGFGTNEGMVLAKYPFAGGEGLVTAVKVYISNDAANVGKTVHGVAWDEWDNEYEYSAANVIQNSDLGQFKRLVLTNPLRVKGGLYAGLKQTANAAAYYPVAFQSEGPPARPDIFYKDTPPYGSLDDLNSGRLMIEAVVRIVPAAHEYSEEILAVWNFLEMSSPVSAPAQNLHRNLTSSNLLTRGPGAPPSPGNNSFATTGFGANGISISNTDYFQFEIGAGTVDTLSLSSIEYGSFWLDSSFFHPGGVTTQFAYSLNGVNFTLIGSPVNTSFHTQGGTVDLQTITALQNILNGNKVYFRFYASGGNNTSPFGFTAVYPEERDLAVYGIIKTNVIIADPVVPVGADYYLATCSSTATGSIGFTSIGNFAPGNIYSAKINTSIWYNDTVAVTIGTLASNANSGTINFTIPAGIDNGLWGNHEGYIDIWIESSSRPGAISIPSKEFKLTIGEHCYNANDVFRSKQSGNWNNLAIWEMSADGSTWVPSIFIPDQRAQHVKIMAADTVTIITGVNMRNISVAGKIKVLNGGANNGSITFFQNEWNSIIRDHLYCMQIERGGVLQIVSNSANYNSVIIESPSYWRPNKQLIRNLGTITIGDGSSLNGNGFHYFAIHQYKKFKFFDESVFEWNSTSANGPISNAIYFKLSPGNPVFRLTKMPAGTFGGADSTLMNATLEVNTPVTMSGSGSKIFTDGIKGSSTLTQAPGSGEFRTLVPYTLIPPSDTTGGSIGVTGGTIAMVLNSVGINYINGTAVTTTDDVKITGPGTSYGDIQIQPGGRMTIDPASVLTIQNGDLTNEGTLDGAGIVRFTGADTSLLRSPGIINTKIELQSKQLRLGSDAITTSIDLLGGSKLKLDSFDLNMRTGNLGGDSLNFIVTNDTGRLIRNVTTSDVLFHIGINEASYSPVTITNTGTADNFGVRVGPGVFKDTAITTGNVNRTWFISDSLEGGSNVKLKMQWRSDAEQPSFLRGSSYISHAVVCPPPINCAGSYQDAYTIGAASGVGSGYFSIERSGISNFNTSSFFVTSRPFVYTFTGNGNWNNVNNWTPGIIPPSVIPAGTEVIINHSSAPGSKCIHSGNITVQLGGKLSVLPGKTLEVQPP